MAVQTRFGNFLYFMAVFMLSLFVAAFIILELVRFWVVG